MNTHELGYNIRAWLAHPLGGEVRSVIQRIGRAEDVRHVAIMPDVHLAEHVCVGAVIATTRTLLPDAVGGDIGCGMAAMAFEAGADVIVDESDAMAILGRLRNVVPTNHHRGPRDARSLPANLRTRELSVPSLGVIARRDGIVQLGTLGSGNHFLELQEDEEGMLWVTVHSGSRAVGQKIKDWHTSRSSIGNTGLHVLDATSDQGSAYLADVDWARTYAAANRRAMVDATARTLRDLMGIRAIENSFFDCDHNHVAAETHFGQSLWVHRKGASRAGDREAGIIPGSMGTPSYHTEGRGNVDSLRSSSHGAGRAMSRGEAMARIRSADFIRKMQGVWFDHRRARRLIEESPDAYKDIRQVMRAQRDLTRIVRTLRPILSYKGT